MILLAVEKDKENEIMVVPKLLQYLNLRNTVAIDNAIHTQRKLSTQIAAAGGEHLGNTFLCFRTNIVQEDHPKVSSSYQTSSYRSAGIMK